MLNFLDQFFGSPFTPHGHCMWWTPDLIGLHVISDAVIALSYFSIPITLVYFVMRRKDLPFPWLFAMFALFILACGTSHIMDIWNIWHANYYAEGIVKAVTAVASVITAVLLIPLIPKALALRSPAELEIANHRLQESERSKNAFFANVSHEFRTPLTLILAPIESMLAGEYGPLDDRISRAAATVQGNAVRLLQLVNSLLDLSRIEAGKMETRRAALEIVSATRIVLADFEPLMRQKALRWKLNVDTPAAWIMMDRYFYERILFNLLSNAVKFTPAGGEIVVSLKTSDGRLALRVADTGIGIAEEKISRLFERFYQVESSPTRRFEGTGIGLSLVHEFAALLEGGVSVESRVTEPERGTVFTVECAAPPAVGERDSSSVEMVRRSAPLASGHAEPRVDRADARGLPKVLVAEDNADLAVYIQNTLCENMNVRTAADGEEALAAALEWKPDLVLSDVMMPKLDGLSLCKALKSASATSGTPVVLLTALTDRDALLRGWEAGADEYLVKPFHPKELLMRVRSLLAVSRSRRLAAEAAADANRVLEERVKERTEALENANRDLETMLHIASHDLRSPLQAIGHFARSIKGRSSNSLDDKSKDHLERIGRAATRMSRLLDDLLRLSRAQLAKAEPEIVAASDIVVDVLARLSASIDETRARVKVSDNLPDLHADRALATEAVLNLVSNAIKFAVPGVPPELEVEPYHGREGDGIAVLDRGAGVPPEMGDRIFEMFQRGVGQDVEGTGAGLTIVRRIARRCGGEAWFENREGGGSKFIITFSPARVAG